MKGIIVLTLSFIYLCMPYKLTCEQNYYKCYYNETDVDPYTLYLDFYDNNTYEMILYYSASYTDILIEVTISYGTYTENKQFFYLKDEIFNLKFVCKKISNSNQIVITDGLKFIKNLKLDNYNCFYPNYGNPKESISIFKEGVKKIKKKYFENLKLKHNFSFTHGYYYLSYFDKEINFSIDLRPNNTYTYYFRDGIVCEGKWRKEGNSIFLKDDQNPGVEYILLVMEDNQLSAVFLPMVFSNDGKLTDKDRLFKLEKAYE